MTTPTELVGFALGLLLLGLLLVFLVVLRVLDASLPLLLLAYAASLAGLCLGLAGLARERHLGP